MSTYPYMVSIAWHVVNAVLADWQGERISLGERNRRASRDREPSSRGLTCNGSRHLARKLPECDSGF